MSRRRLSFPGLEHLLEANIETSDEDADDAVDEATAPPTPAAPQASRRCDEALPAASDLAREAFDRLVMETKDAPASEQLLFEVAANSAATFAKLQEAEMKLATRLIQIVDTDARAAVAVAKALKETVAVGSILAARVRSVLGAAGTLRLQRRHFEARRDDN